MQTATLIINQETLRQTLRAEKEHWIKLRQFFNVNHELIGTFAGEQFYTIACFAGLLSFVNCNRNYRAKDFAEFMQFEKRTHIYASSIQKLENFSAMSEQQLKGIFSYLIRRSALVEAFVEEVFYNIHNQPAPPENANGKSDET